MYVCLSPKKKIPSNFVIFKIGQIFPKKKEKSKTSQIYTINLDFSSNSPPYKGLKNTKNWWKFMFFFQLNAEIS